MKGEKGKGRGIRRDGRERRSGETRKSMGQRAEDRIQNTEDSQSWPDLNSKFCRQQS